MAVEPVLVAVLAYVILGEGLSTRQIVGGTIAVGALAVVAANLGVHEGRAPVPKGFRTTGGGLGGYRAV